MKIDLKAIAAEVALVVKTAVSSLEQKFAGQFEEVTKRLDEFPVPKDGVDGTSVTLEEVTPVVQAAVEAAVAPAVEAAVAAIPVPENGKDGQDGKSVTVEEVLPILEEKLQEAIAAIPEPVHGVDGKDGTSVVLEDVIPVIAEEVAKHVGDLDTRCKTAVEAAVAEIPIPSNGADGKDGTSVTVDDVRPIVEELVKAIPAPENGKDGADGASVSIEDVKPLLKSLVDEIPLPKDGERGSDGRDGRDGEDGRDALELEILPAIVEEKSYPRGSYASHKGGLWRARKNTDGMDGWECVVRGVHAIEVVVADDHRTVEVKHILSDSEHTHTVKMANVLDRGIFKEGITYDKHDGVTFGGSFWIAQKENPQGRPGFGETDWRLAVKAGKPGSKGDPGEKGKDGKNAPERRPY